MVQYNHQNLCNNVGEDIKALTNDLYTFQSEAKRKMSEEHLKSQREINYCKSLAEEHEKKFNNFYEKSASKEELIDSEIFQLWENVKKIRKIVNIPLEVEATSIQKRLNPRSSESKPAGSKGLLQKVKSNGRHSFAKEHRESFDQSMTSALEYASLTAKV